VSVDHETDADTDTTGEASDPEQVERLATELGTAIADLPVYREFEAAKQAVEADDDVQERIGEFERLREEFAVARQTGQADEAALEELRDAQERLHSMPKMDRYLAAQERLEERLETFNEAISAPLGVDFGGEAGGCCRDE
jgi:Uncharacterized conserved protein